MVHCTPWLPSSQAFPLPQKTSRGRCISSRFLSLPKCTLSNGVLCRGSPPSVMPSNPLGSSTKSSLSASLLHSDDGTPLHST